MAFEKRFLGIPKKKNYDLTWYANSKKGSARCMKNRQNLKYNSLMSLLHKI